MHSVQFSRSVVSDSLATPWTAAPQASLSITNPRHPCPSPTPRPCSNSCPSSQWWHPTISSSVVPFSSCLQSFPESGSFQWCIYKLWYDSLVVIIITLQNYSTVFLFMFIAVLISYGFFFLLVIKSFYPLSYISYPHSLVTTILFCSLQV